MNCRTRFFFFTFSITISISTRNSTETTATHLAVTKSSFILYPSRDRRHPVASPPKPAPRYTKPSPKIYHRTEVNRARTIVSSTTMPIDDPGREEEAAALDAAIKAQCDIHDAMVYIGAAGLTDQVGLTYQEVVEAANRDYNTNHYWGYWDWEDISRRIADHYGRFEREPINHDETYALKTLGPNVNRRAQGYIPNLYLENRCRYGPQPFDHGGPWKSYEDDALIRLADYVRERPDIQDPWSYIAGEMSELASENNWPVHSSGRPFNANSCSVRGDITMYEKDPASSSARNPQRDRKIEQVQRRAIES